jgi:hypothetical protein
VAGREAGKRKGGHGRVKEVGWCRGRGRGWEQKRRLWKSQRNGLEYRRRGRGQGRRQGRERKVTEESRRWAGVGEEGGGWEGGRKEQGRSRKSQVRGREKGKCGVAGREAGKRNGGHGRVTEVGWSTGRGRGQKER